MFLGGHTRFQPGTDGRQPDFGAVGELARRVEAHENVDLLTDVVAMGAYDRRWILAFADERLYKVRADAVVAATGARDRHLVFTHNDLPGILTGQGAARLLNLYGVRPGRRAVIVSANDDGLRLALALQRAGVEVVVAEERGQENSRAAQAVGSAGVAVYWRHSISEAVGKRHVQGVNLLPLDRAGSRPASPSKAVRLDADTVVLSVGYQPEVALLAQQGACIEWDRFKNELVPAQFPQRIHGAGRVCGSYETETALLEGRLAGLDAALDAGYGPGPPQEERDLLRERKASEPSRTTPHVSLPGPGSFRFVDLSEDVTEKDVYDALAEGYDGIELLKRYTTISMGPDQGRYGAIHGMLLAARARGQEVKRIGVTRSRPPVLPVKMGTLAGRKLDPVRRSPLYSWHEGYGCARWLRSGHWIRPERYERHAPEQEVLTVRQRAGIIDVSTLGKVHLYGRDVPELLSRLYTNKWRYLPVGKARYGVMCNEAGTIVDDGVTARVAENEYYMTLTTINSDTIPESILWWQEQRGWDLDVHLANVTTHHTAINVAGPKSRELLARIAQGVDLSNESFPFMAVRRGRVAGVDALLLRIGFTGELSYELHIPAGWAEHVWRELLDRGDDLGILPFGLEAQGILRLEKGHILIGQDTAPLTSPLEAGLDGIVKDDKPDFLGKAAILRRKRDGLRRALVGFEMLEGDFVPPEGEIVVERAAARSLEKIGWVTSARFSPTLGKAIGLAQVRSDRSMPGTGIAIWSGGKRRARVVELPF